MKSLSCGIALLCAAIIGCSSSKGKTRSEGPPISERFADDFERAKLGDAFFATTDNYSLVNGALSAKGARNHPLWLTRALPKNVRIEFDAWSNSADGDIKVEFFGDGQSHAETRDKVAYSPTGFVAILGGWNNSKSVLALRDEHRPEGKNLVSRTAPKVEVGKRYHWKIEVQDGEVRWFVDDMSKTFLSLDDPTLPGEESQRYFGFNNWDSDSWFDNLVIEAL